MPHSEIYLDDQIRPATSGDSKALKEIIHRVMPEFGADKPGFAIHDPEVDDMYSAYNNSRSAYFVVELDGSVVGGCGIAPLAGASEDVCELRKMYFLPHARGKGLGHKMLKICLDQAVSLGYKKCYLETLERMHQARALYEKFGFTSIPKPMGNTGHFGCDSWFIKML
jgi:putative acetyltransferase